ncbi:MAG: hypothetical protein HUN04_20660 [Desulfobacter sp.]|nr:MAG: hypothetical protein HUN04_20660 [Desulfobacter sp.]
MKNILILFMFLAFYPAAFAENAVTIPYGEFKKLYGDEIRRELMAEAPDTPFIHTISSTRYDMAIGPEGALCRAEISGSMISGSPEAIPLFSDKIIIREVKNVTGGALVSGEKNSGGICFFPSGDPAFSLALTFFIPAGEDNNSAYIALKIPRALENALAATAQNDTVLLDLPGVQTRTGTWHFSPRSTLKIRFSHGAAARARAAEKQAAISRSYKAVSTPPVVLDTVHCFTTFEEGGNILSVISAKIPPEAGAAFAVKALAGAEIWQCKINNKKVKVYKSPGGDWIFPLARDRDSRLELSLLSRGRKLGLHGRLDLTLPRMALPARRINIALGLPKRVELVSFQGPLSPSRPFKARAPGEFSGTPYYFSRSFHKGEAVTMAVSYKEPVKKGNPS